MVQTSNIIESESVLPPLFRQDLTFSTSIEFIVIILIPALSAQGKQKYHPIDLFKPSESQETRIFKQKQCTT